MEICGLMELPSDIPDPKDIPDVTWDTPNDGFTLQVIIADKFVYTWNDETQEWVLNDNIE